MSAVTEADNDDQAAELLAAHNVIDGLSLVISQQRAVMRQALEALEAGDTVFYPQTKIAITALRNSLEGKQ